MVIAGLQKMTLLDYPGKVACTVFLQGCNFRCPFCHNSDLLGGNAPDTLTVEDLLAFLHKRKGLLDAVCITGGEPTLQPDLPELIRAIKDLGYAVKLDTNGSRPAVLKALAAENLLDYVAMDVKNAPARYAETVGVPSFDLTPVEESLAFLLGGSLPYELRTTVVSELHDEQDFEEIGNWLCRLCPTQQAPRFFLQSFVDRDSVLQSGLHAPSEAKLQAFRDRIAPFVACAAIRGSQ